MLNLTPSALKAVNRFITTSADPVAGLRIHVQGGGCSGLQYGMKLETEKSEDDVSLEIDGVTILVDPFSAPMLDGVTVDFVDSLPGFGFKFENPNATAGCACGQSFSRSTARAGWIWPSISPGCRTRWLWSSGRCRGRLQPDQTWSPKSHAAHLLDQ